MNPKSKPVLGTLTEARRHLQRRLMNLATWAQDIAYQAEGCDIDPVHVRDIRQSMFYFRRAVNEIDALIHRTRSNRGGKRCGRPPKRLA